MVLQTRYGTHITTGSSFVFGEDYWGSQPIFDISRPMRLGHYICTNVPYSFSFISNHGNLFNLSAMHQNGIVKKLNGSTSEYVPAEYDYTVAPYGEEMVISDMGLPPKSRQKN